MQATAIHVRQAVFTTGERFPVILDEDGFPLSLPTRYIIDRPRDRGRQTNSIRGILTAISYYYRWAATLHQPFDPEQRLRTGSLLTSAEAIGLQRYLRAGRRHNVEIFPGKAVALSRNGTVISNNCVNVQFGRIRDYLAWAAEYERSPRASAKEIDGLKKRFDTLGLTRTRTKDKYGLTAEQQEDLLRLLEPQNPENPFNRPVRYRNQLIVRLLMESGVRRGELCKVRIQDLNLRSAATAFMAIERNPDDPWDPRKNEPQVKTLRRRIPLRSETKALLFDFLQKHRGRSRYPYLFVSSRGGIPVDVSAINGIFSAIRSRMPEFENVELTPHTLRRTFEDNLERSATALGWDGEKAKKVTNYLSGWTEQSNQAAVYQRRATEEAAMVAMEKLHELNTRIYSAAAKPKDDIPYD